MSEEETLRIENAQAGIDAAGDRETPSLSSTTNIHGIKWNVPDYGQTLATRYVEEVAFLNNFILEMEEEGMRKFDKLEEKDDRIQELNGKIANLEYDLKNCENGYNMAIQNEAVSRAISDELRDLLKIALKK